MFTKKLLIILLIAVISITACASEAPSAPVATPAQNKHITLRLGLPDGDDVLYAPYVLEFVEQVKILSNENIAIKPVWQAGDTTDAGYEKGVIQLVIDGEADLGLAASRAWDPKVFPNLQVLQAPFLITDDTLAGAVATSDIAARVLDGLSSGGVVGLTLWPEDLRHPFSVDPAKPILSPEDFVGLDVRTTDTGISEMLIKALGGNPIFEASDYQGAESGLRQGATLTGRPAATGNVTFFPKYQVLFANGVAFEALSEEQRSILRQAAAAAQTKAIAERPGEVNAGSSWCADGGTIVLASDEQVAAFEKAAEPVFDLIKQDPFNAEMIVAINELKAKIAPSPGAEACASPVAQQIPVPGTDTQVWSAGLPPNGVWQVTLTNDDVIKLGVSKANAPEWSGVFTHTFKNGVFHSTWLGTEGNSKGQTSVCDGTYKLVEDFVRITLSSDCGNEVDDIQWRLDEDGLRIHLVAIKNGMPVEIKAILEAKPYQKIADQ